MRVPHMLALGFFLTICTFPLRAQLPYVETDILMRDGNTLRADLYHNGGTTEKPVILIQTPYNKAFYRIRLGLPSNTTFPLDTAQYHYAFVDWRGFFASSGAAVAGYDRGLDGYDLVEWLAAQPWCNGKVASYGGSALGMIQFQTARHHPPHLVCAVPMIIDYRTDYFDYYYGGVLRREHVETLERLGFVAVDVITARPVENALWRIIQEQNDYPEEISIPLLMVSGWFDHYPTEVLRAFRDLRANSDASVRDQHKLIMGPWLHDGVDQEKQGELVFPQSARVARDAALQFFAYHLLGAKNGWPLQPVLRYYRMGENVWNTSESWDALAAAEQSWYLRGDGRLTAEAPAAAEAERSYTYDPRDPSPSHGGPRFNPFDATLDPGPIDISTLVEQRDDVLLYTSDALTQYIRVQGKMSVELYVRSDRRDTDFSVRLCDVQPDGRSIILTDGIIRARFREGTDREVFLEDAVPTKVVIALQDMAHTFLSGHRIRLVVGSADYPRFDININNGEDMYVAGDTLAAHNRIVHSAATPSRLLLTTAAPLTSIAPPAVSRASGIRSIAPQPFRTGQSDALTIHGEIDVQCRDAVLDVTDMLGRVRRCIEIPAQAGAFTLQWDGKDAFGNALPAGTYLMRLRGETVIHSRSVLILP